MRLDPVDRSYSTLRAPPVILFAFLACSLLPIRAGDRAPSPHPRAPSLVPRPLVPEVQTDDFSCGYHALSAIYRSYRLDPARANLRARLGTSRPAIPFVSDSNGTLQPDLFRVLQQDGFKTETIHPKDPDDRRKLVLHLHKGHYGLALLTTERAGGLHWIVFTDQEEGVVTVADSLRRGLQKESLDDLNSGPLLSVILLRPGQPAPGSPYYRAHASGLLEMALTSIRSLPTGVIIVLLTLCVLILWFVVRLLRSMTSRLLRHVRS